MYPFNTPGAFVPHSAINLSRTKEEESPVSQSLDLSVSESGTAGANVSSTGEYVSLHRVVLYPDNNILFGDYKVFVINILWKKKPEKSSMFL